MSNWITCNPANPLREGSTNIFCIMSLNVTPNESVSCKVQVQYQNSALSVEFINIAQPEYGEWGADDNWIYQKIAQKLFLGTLASSNSPGILAPATSQIFYDDTRSVHNDADLQKITTLEEQMIEQQRLVSQLKSILISKGMI